MANNNKPGLGEIRGIVDFTAQKEREKISNYDAILKAKQDLERFSKNKTQKFTYTVGTVNAYMG